MVHNANDNISTQLMSLMVDASIEINVITKDGVRYCNLCPYNTKQVRNMRDHIEIHFPISFPCNFCDRTVQTRHNLRSNVYRNHRGK